MNACPRRLFSFRLSTWMLAAWLVPATSMFAQDKLDTLSSENNASAPANEPKVNLGEIRKALRQLDSEQSTDRDAAEKRLIELGPSVLPFLPEITSRTSGEMKIRLQRIRQQLQNTKIEVFFESSLVTLNGKMSAVDAFEAINKQTGNQISIQNRDALVSQQLELAYDKKPFWQVMDSLLSETKLRIEPFSNSEGMVLVPAGDYNAVPGPLPSTDGPFQVRIRSAQVTLPFGERNRGQLDVSLQVNWEPRLKPVYLQLPMAKMKATHADGELSSTNPAANPEIPVNASSAATQIDLQLERPSRSVRKIDKLSGEFIAAVPSEKHKYVFDKFANGKRQSEKYGEVTVTLENARRNGSVYEIRILAEFQESQGALDSFRGWILSNRAYLLDEKETRIENVGLQTYSVTNEAVGVAFLFQINSDPNNYTLVYESPGMITRQTVKFEIEDIDLP